MNTTEEIEKAKSEKHSHWASACDSIGWAVAITVMFYFLSSCTMHFTEHKFGDKNEATIISNS